MASRLRLHLACCLCWTALALASWPPPAETAATIIAALNLTANPEKGYYTQTFVDPLSVTYTAITANGTAYRTTRAASTAIYYLLEGSEGDSYWHRHDGLEVWHYYAGAPLRLSLSCDDGEPVRQVVLGGHVVGGREQQRPQGFVGRWEWQSARSLGKWTLVGTTGKFDTVPWLERDWCPGAVLVPVWEMLTRTRVAPGFSAEADTYEIAAADWHPRGA